MGALTSVVVEVLVDLDQVDNLDLDKANLDLGRADNLDLDKVELGQDLDIKQQKVQHHLMEDLDLDLVNNHLMEDLDLVNLDKVGDQADHDKV